MIDQMEADQLTISNSNHRHHLDSQKQKKFLRIHI